MPITAVVHIEAVQYTVGTDPVIIQYSADSGPLARATQLHTTQTALIARSATPDTWADAEVQAELLAYLADNGITATFDSGSDAGQGGDA